MEPVGLEKPRPQPIASKHPKAKPPCELVNTRGFIFSLSKVAGGSPQGEAGGGEGPRLKTRKRVLFMRVCSLTAGWIPSHFIDGPAAACTRLFEFSPRERLLTSLQSPKRPVLIGARRGSSCSLPLTCRGPARRRRLPGRGLGCQARPTPLGTPPWGGAAHASRSVPPRRPEPAEKQCSLRCEAWGQQVFSQPSWGVADVRQTARI